MWPIVIVAVTLFVAYANGANDNCKGVATLFGSAVANGQTRWGGAFAPFLLPGYLPCRLQRCCPSPVIWFLRRCDFTLLGFMSEHPILVETVTEKIAT
jgi:hypothetical protein